MSKSEPAPADLGAVADTCQHCGQHVGQSTTGRPKRFCSDRCRKAASRVSGHDLGNNAPECGSAFSDPLSPTSDALAVSSEPTETSEALSTENAELRFEEVNDVTLKLTDGGGSNVPGSHAQWGGYRAARALAWVSNVGPGHKSWLARCGNRSVGPTTIGQAKKAALSMVADQGIGKVLDDPVEHLNKLAARLLDAEPSEAASITPGK